MRPTATFGPYDGSGPLPCIQGEGLRAAEARGVEPRMGANPNRISSSDRGRSDWFSLDQRLWPVLLGRPCTAVNCNPKLQPGYEREGPSCGHGTTWTSWSASFI